MALGAKFTIDCDSSKGVAGVNAFGNAMDGLANTVKGELSTKLKVLFSAAAIEEAARRTGEWAQKLDQSSKSMGVTNTMLSTLYLLANKANIPEEAVVGMFDNIDKARSEALAGNIEYINSLERLGVTLEDTRNLSREAFSNKVVAGMQNVTTQNNGDASTANNLNRQDISRVSGATPENFLNQLFGAHGLAGKSLSSKKEEYINNKDIPNEEVVDELSATWSEFLTDIKVLGNELRPTAAILIAIFDLLLNTLGGVYDLLKGTYDTITGVLTGDNEKIVGGIKKIGGLFNGIVFGVVKMFTGIIDFLAKGIVGVLKTVLGKVPIIGKAIGGLLDEMKTTNLTSAVENLEKDSKEFYGEKNTKRGEALGQVAGTILTGGEALVGKAGANALGKVGLGESKLGTHLTSVGNGDSGLLGGKSIQERLSPTTIELEDFTNSFEKNEERFQKTVFGTNTKEERAEYNAKLIADMRASAKERGRLTKLGISAAAGAAGREVATQSAYTKTGVAGSDITPILPNNGIFGEQKGQGGSSLSIGGLFGSNFQSRIIQLNQDMVKLLSQIQANTQVGRGVGYTQPGGSQYGGGS